MDFFTFLFAIKVQEYYVEIFSSLRTPDRAFDMNNTLYVLEEDTPFSEVVNKFYNVYFSLVPDTDGGAQKGAALSLPGIGTGASPHR